MNNRTFAIIKPDAVRNGNTGKIYDRILKADFKILCAKLIRMTVAQAEGFYAIHKERPFFNELTEFMSSGACMVLALEKDDAVNQWRKTIGATNPDDADLGTIRKAILLQMYKKMQFMVQILMKMQKKRLDFSSHRVNL